LHDPSVSLEDWLRFVRRIGRNASASAGLIAIRDCRGIVHALFSYRVDFDLRARKRLCITHLVWRISPARPSTPRSPRASATSRRISTASRHHRAAVRSAARPAAGLLDRGLRPAA